MREVPYLCPTPDGTALIYIGRGVNIELPLCPPQRGERCVWGIGLICTHCFAFMGGGYEEYSRCLRGVRKSESILEEHLEQVVPVGEQQQRD